MSEPNEWDQFVLTCPECEHLLETDAQKCPTCTAADNYDGPVQTTDF